MGLPLSRHYDKTAAVYRLADVAATDHKEQYALHIASLAGMLQPEQSGFSEDLDGNFGKTFFFVCDTADIKEHDRIVIEGANYRVIGVESFAFLGRPSHMEIGLRLSDD